MSDALLTWHLHCWPRTGSATLLPNLGNLPTSSSVMSSQPTHVLKLRSHIKSSDPLCNRRQRARRGIDSSNPHSAVASRHDPAVSSPEYYPTPALAVGLSGKPLFDGRRRIILNNNGYLIYSVFFVVVPALLALASRRRRFASLQVRRENRVRHRLVRPGLVDVPIRP